jgi:hypothetical protein
MLPGCEAVQPAVNEERVKKMVVQLDVHVFMCILYSSIFFLALHVSGAICTHPQEHKLQRTAIGVCNGFGVLIHWSRYWLGHLHTFSTVRVSQPVAYRGGGSNPPPRNSEAGPNSEIRGK